MSAAGDRPGTSGRSAWNWAPIWVRPAGVGPAAFRRVGVPAITSAVSAASAPSSAPAAPGASAPRLDEATRRLLRVPSLVAETAARLGGRGAVGDAADTPLRPTRRRGRRTHTRRPPSGLVRAVPAFGGAGACDQLPGRSVVPAYRMSRRARLSLTLTVFAAVVVLAANALMSGGPSVTTEVTVVAGDSLWSIAQRTAPDDEVWSVIDEISALNGLTGTDVVPGQVLVVPVG